MWDLDTIGISPSEESAKSKVLEDFEGEVRFENGRYTVRLPWKDEETKTTLVENRVIAERRLQGLIKRLEKDPSLKTRYNDVIADLEERGIVEEVPTEEMVTNFPTFYLPHHPVVKESSRSTKVRPVFDASCKGVNGISLNDCMEKGPKMIPDLVKILLRFRRWQYGLSADIQKAFLMIGLHTEDKDVHRFLWNVNDQIRTMRFTRVTFGNAASPFLLNATVQYHLARFDECRTVKELKDNLYVDDWLTGADSEEEICKMMSEGEKTMKEGGFTLTKWASNSQAARREHSKMFGEFDEMSITKVLGLSWKTTGDYFHFVTLLSSEIGHCSKRILLSIIARLFDPLGLLTPFSITLKVLFQETWRRGFDWDDVLPNEFQVQMKAWIEGLDYVRDWKILRCISPVAWDGGSQKELIVFADASEKAYGCCVYLRTTVNGQVFVNLVTSKTRVAPLKKTTLPRLELLAALLAARLLKFVTSALQLETTGNSYTCWSDSQVALSWIKSNAAKWKQFVQNRVLEIQELTSPERWHFCRGKENPADLLTRGISAREMTNSNMWLHGPAWLNESQPRSDEEIPDWTREEEDEDARETVLVMTPVEGTKNLLEYDRFSDFGKLVRVVTWVLRFTTNCRPHQERRSSSELSPGELENGGITLLRCIQRERYGEEIEQLISGRDVKGGSSISRLSPFIGKDGLLRMQGRLAFASSLLYDEKHPIILPKCHLTLLLVKNKHYMMKHAGVDTLVTAIRNNFWIVSVRTLAKKICRSCIHCQRQDSRACKQAMAPLPEDRVKKSPSFSVIGIDHAGPLFCSDTSNRKLYILLFTCAVVRAVHLELVDSLSLEDFILAFKRFVARRGHPSIIYSDNAQTFKAAHKVLQRELGYMGLDWKFSAPLAPW